MYVCECEPGYGHGEDDDTCSTEIDECKELQPCVNGACMDQVNDYLCTCETEDRLVNGKTQPTAIWGGKNCDVELDAIAGHYYLFYILKGKRRVGYVYQYKYLTATTTKFKLSKLLD